MGVERLRSFAVIAALALVTGCQTPGSGGDARGEMGPEGSDEVAMREGDRIVTGSERLPLDFRTIYFAFDQSELRPAAKSDLKFNAEVMRQHPKTRLLVEGHCDERGTNEYNLALGERRARAAKSYLVDLGVSASRIQTASYGEERPMVAGHNEQAWAKNRRDEFAHK